MKQDKVSVKREHGDTGISHAEREKVHPKDKIYISGPISNRPLGVAINHFMLADAMLQTQGYRTCNPLKMRLCVWLAQHGHYRLCLWIQLLWMSVTCQRIYLLEGWHLSDGARAERAVARVMGITALYERQRKPSPFGLTAEALAELGKALAACGVHDKTTKHNKTH